METRDIAAIRARAVCFEHRKDAAADVRAASYNLQWPRPRSWMCSLCTFEAIACTARPTEKWLKEAGLDMCVVLRQVGRVPGRESIDAPTSFTSRALYCAT